MQKKLYLCRRKGFTTGANYKNNRQSIFNNIMKDFTHRALVAKKKSSYLFAMLVAAVAITFTGCGEQNEPENPSKFKISTSNVTQTSFDIEIVPADKNIYYIFGRMKSAQFLERPNVFAKTFITSGTYPQNLVNGTQKESYINLNSGTEYAVFACEVNENYEIVGDVEYVLVTPGESSSIPEEKVPEGAIAGKFKIYGRTIYFSKGNLQYRAGSYNTWRFAEHQWEIIGAENEKISKDYTGWIDLFGFGATGYNQRMPYLGNESTIFNTSENLEGTYYDWGNYCIIENGGNTRGIWRTLDPKDWEYIIFNRPNAAQRVALAQVNSINGMILLPDEWNHPAGAPDILFNMNDFTANKFSVSQWEKMEKAGAVFLPAAGYRDSKQVSSGGKIIDEPNHVFSVGTLGLYWSSSINDGYSSYHLIFPYWYDFAGETKFEMAKMRWSDYNVGLSVRLVQDVK